MHYVGTCLTVNVHDMFSASMHSNVFKCDVSLTVHHELTIQGVPGGMCETSGGCSLR